MSKSKLNGVSPDQALAEFSSDVLKTALMFAAPPESDLNFSWKLLESVQQFLQSVEKLEIIEGEFKKESLQKCYKLFLDYEFKMGKDRQFHVAIARLMEIVNLLKKEPGLYKIIANDLLLALYPFAPLMAADTAKRLGIEKLGTPSDYK